MKRIFVLFLTFLTILSLGILTGCGQKTVSGNVPVTETETASGPYQFCSNELEHYVIVYAGDNPDYFDLAYQLNDQIFSKYGKILITTSDTNSTPAQYEILLGDTNRYDHHSRVMEYSVTVDEGKFRINVGGSFSAEQAVNFLCETVFNGQEFALDNGEYYQTAFLTTTQEMTDGATARIMTANLLADAFADNSYRKAHYRAEIFAGMLVSYTPDVLGLQETDAGWNNVLDAYLTRIEKAHGIRYCRHWGTYQNKVNYTSLLYRADKFKVDNGDVSTFRWWTDPAFNHSYHMRNISWAQFSSLENPEKNFIVANTHWSYRTEHSDGNTYLAGANSPIAANELRVQCKDETNATLTALRQTYPETPIFLTGDFNTSLPFFTESGWTPSAFRVISEEALANRKSVALVPSSGFFDHLFGTGDYTVEYYAFFQDANQHSLLTDHPFAYADLTF